MSNKIKNKFMDQNKTTRRDFLKMGVGAAASLGLLSLPLMNTLFAEGADRKKKPNVVLVYFDDLGYADFSCYGSKVKTPNIDAIAQGGIKFDRYYAPSNVCSPSRAGTLTGCYPQRVSVNNVFFPQNENGLNTEEETIADLLKQRGYSTMCVGKWHLGHKPKNLPSQFGFDKYFGLPYSNDMWPYNNFGKRIPKKAKMPPLRIYTDDTPGEIINTMEQQGKLTGRMTRKSVEFIEENKDNPFFLYLAHPMPHVPIAASESFKGKSNAGLYYDVIQELDWSIGEVRKTLRKNGLTENTLLIVTSDNGPWLQYGNWGGKADPLREGKTTTFEGGHRVPCLMEMPGTIPAGKVSKEVVGGIDILPTVSALTGAALPKKKIDGKNILPILQGKEGASSPHKYYYYFAAQKGVLQAISKGKWKLHLPHSYFPTEGKPRGKDGIYIKNPEVQIPLSLFDLEADPGERNDLSADHPELVKELSMEALLFHKRLQKEKRPLG